MRRAITILSCFLVVAVLCAAADEAKYSFHENVRLGEVIPQAMTCQTHYHTISTEGGQSKNSDVESFQSFRAVATVLAVKDGSATAMRVVVDSASYDTEKNNGQAQTKTPCGFAGKTVTLRRRADQSIATDFHGQVDPVDEDNLEGLLNPDEDFYPDHPVAVGDVWDVSGKLAVHSDLGPQDKLQAKCRLDWVKDIDGKQMAQITCSSAIIRYNAGNIEEDVESTGTLQVDMAACAIVKAHQTLKSTFSTPKTEPVQVSGGGEVTFDGQATPAAAATSPSTRQ